MIKIFVRNLLKSKYVKEKYLHKKNISEQKISLSQNIPLNKMSLEITQIENQYNCNYDVEYFPHY